MRFATFCLFPWRYSYNIIILFSFHFHRVLVKWIKFSMFLEKINSFTKEKRKVSIVFSFPYHSITLCYPDNLILIICTFYNITLILSLQFSSTDCFCIRELCYPHTQQLANNLGPRPKPQHTHGR